MYEDDKLDSDELFSSLGVPPEGPTRPPGVTVRQDDSMRHLIVDLAEDVEILRGKYLEADVAASYEVLQRCAATVAELMRGFGLEPNHTIVPQDPKAQHFTPEQQAIADSLSPNLEPPPKDL
jgi:hypothetical protein